MAAYGAPSRRSLPPPCLLGLRRAHALLLIHLARRPRIHMHCALGAPSPRGAELQHQGHAPRAQSPHALPLLPGPRAPTPGPRAQNHRQAPPLWPQRRQLGPQRQPQPQHSAHLPPSEGARTSTARRLPTRPGTKLLSKSQLGRELLRILRTGGALSSTSARTSRIPSTAVRMHTSPARTTRTWPGRSRVTVTAPCPPPKPPPRTPTPPCPLSPSRASRRQPITLHHPGPRRSTSATTRRTSRPRRAARAARPTAPTPPDSPGRAPRARRTSP